MKALDVLVPLQPQHLDMLEWFGQWTPEVHRVLWEVRRSWPPGYRGVSDLSVHYQDKIDKAVRLMTAPPPSCFKVGPSRTLDLLRYELVEGYPGCARLTPRGRAALKHHGRACPDAFVSHAPDVFDAVPLLPVALRGMYQPGDRNCLVDGTQLPDTPESWAAMLAEYREGDYRGRNTITRATASLVVGSSTGMVLNGSIRMHHRLVTVAVSNNAGDHVCEFSLSFEQLADLLTSNSSVPVTLGTHIGRDGMLREEPPPPFVTATQRMQARLEQGTNRTTAQVRAVMAKVEASTLGVKAKADLLHDLQVVLNCGDSGHAYAVQQATDEMSQAVESLFTLALDRAELSGAGPLALKVAEKTRALLASEAGEER